MFMIIVYFSPIFTLFTYQYFLFFLYFYTFLVFCFQDIPKSKETISFLKKGMTIPIVLCFQKAQAYIQ